MRGKKSFFTLGSIAALVSVLIIPVWIFFIAPEILKIPNNFNYSADIISVDNFYDAETGDFSGEQYSQTEYAYEVESRDGDALAIRSTFHVKNLQGDTIYKAEPLYGINAKTGAHIANLGDQPREGYLFAPKNLRSEQSFKYWNVSGNLSVEMEYMAEETLYGLRVFKYRSVDGRVDQTEQLGFLPEVGETLGIKLLSETFLWIEPVSGYLVKKKDLSTDYYYYDLASGERLRPYNSYLNIYEEESVQEHVRLATAKKNLALIVEYGVPAALLLLALIFLLLTFGRSNFVRLFLGKYFIGLAVLTAMLAVTAVTYRSVAHNIDQNNQDSLYQESLKIEELITQRIDIYINTLVGAKALFAASENVSRDEWHAYISALRLEKNYPGVQGVGYAPVVAYESREEFIQTARDEGFGDFIIWPEGERDIVTSILYLEPLDERNLRALGYDMFSDSTRRRAMVQARDTGVATKSGAVTLVQEGDGGKQAGFLVYLPMYRDGEDLPSLESREEKLVGFVYAPFRVNDFMEGILGSLDTQLDFYLYDGLRTESGNQIYAFSDSSETPIEEGFNRINTIYIAGHPWTIAFNDGSAAQKNSIEDALLLLIALGGSAASLLVFSLFYVTVQSREKAINYAEELTRDLVAKKTELAKNNANLKEKVSDLDRSNKVMVDRELEMIKLKEKIGRYEDSL